MAREQKDGRFLNCKLPGTLMDKLAAYHQDSRVPKTAVVEIALTEYLDKVYPDGKVQNMVSAS